MGVEEDIKKCCLDLPMHFIDVLRYLAHRAEHYAPKTLCAQNTMRPKHYAPKTLCPRNNMPAQVYPPGHSGCPALSGGRVTKEMPMLQYLRGHGSYATAYQRLWWRVVPYMGQQNVILFLSKRSGLSTCLSTYEAHISLTAGKERKKEMQPADLSQPSIFTPLSFSAYSHRASGILRSSHCMPAQMSDWTALNLDSERLS